MPRPRFEDLNTMLNVQDILQYAGYVCDKKAGTRWPLYVKLDSLGRAESGNKFLVKPDGRGVFRPGVSRVYSPTSFIYHHPELFAEGHGGAKPSDVVYAVCEKVLSKPVMERAAVRVSQATRKTFNLDEYKVINMDGKDFETAKPFYPYFKSRGIDRYTQLAFHHDFCLTEHRSADGEVTFKNLSFPLRVPGDDKTVGFELRGRPRPDGRTGSKLLAPGSASGVGLWIANLSGGPLENAKDVYWFESGYDAMAYYQIKRGSRDVRKGVFLSTSGQPTLGHFRGVTDVLPFATHHVCFDKDEKGEAFAKELHNVANERNPLAHPDMVPEDMRDYIAAFGRQTETRSFHYLADKAEYAALLPEALREKYHSVTLATEAVNALRFGGTAYSPSDMEAKEKAELAARRDYEHSFNKKLGLDASPKYVVAVRELPPSGKDWNEALLDMEDDPSRTESVRVTRGTGLDADGDGEEDVVEEDLADRDKKHPQPRR